MELPGEMKYNRFCGWNEGRNRKDQVSMGGTEEENIGKGDCNRGAFKR